MKHLQLRRLVGRGFLDQEVAEALGVKPKTVQAYRCLSGLTGNYALAKAKRRFLQEVFGRWVVQRVVMSDRYGVRQCFCKCLCDPKRGGCGAVRWVPGGNLAGGKSQSCGCLQREAVSKKRKAS